MYILQRKVSTDMASVVKPGRPALTVGDWVTGSKHDKRGDADRQLALYLSKGMDASTLRVIEGD